MRRPILRPTLPQLSPDELGVGSAAGRRAAVTRVRSVLAFYRQTLMRDMSDDDFADTFAQTIAYGMFLGRLGHTDGPYTRQVAVAAIPESIPFLRSAVRLLTDEDLLPAAVLRLLDDLAAVLDNTDVAPIRTEVAASCRAQSWSMRDRAKSVSTAHRRSARIPFLQPAHTRNLCSSR